MKKLTIIGIGVLALIVVSCQAPGVGSYYPLALNNTWSYKMTTVTDVRGDTNYTNTSTDSFKTTVVSDTTIGGRKAWKVQTQFHIVITTAYLVEEEDRILAYSSLTDPAPIVALMTLSDNATWVIDSAASTGKVTATVKGKENVTVDAGTFNNAWKVEEKSDSTPDSPFERWYAANVGRIKTTQSKTFTYPTNTKVITTTHALMHYTVK